MSEDNLSAVTALARDLVAIDSRSFVSNLAVAGRVETELHGFEVERIDYRDRDGIEKRALVAHRGRASQVGERSANTPDPGIVAIATILQDWCKECGVERTPTAPEVARATT